uniref:Uncharacterized protein n=1 Tax=Triticum urartu TaxID=4572 RepID=A0A8R7QR00_TRIUA
KRSNPSRQTLSSRAPHPLSHAAAPLPARLDGLLSSPCRRPPPFSLEQRCLSRAAASPWTSVAAAPPWTRRRDGSPGWIPSSGPILHLSGCPVATQQQQATCSSSFLPSMDELDGDVVQPDHGHDYLTHKVPSRYSTFFHG